MLPGSGRLEDGPARARPSPYIFHLDDERVQSCTWNIIHTTYTFPRVHHTKTENMSAYKRVRWRIPQGHPKNVISTRTRVCRTTRPTHSSTQKRLFPNVQACDEQQDQHTASDILIQRCGHSCCCVVNEEAFSPLNNPFNTHATNTAIQVR